jgi:hypothetical protein
MVYSLLYTNPVDRKPHICCTGERDISTSELVQKIMYSIVVKSPPPPNAESEIGHWLGYFPQTSPPPKTTTPTLSQ